MADEQGGNWTLSHSRFHAVRFDDYAPAQEIFNSLVGNESIFVKMDAPTAP